MKHRIRLLFPLLLICSTGVFTAQASEKPPLTIDAGKGKPHHFSVELALTPDEQEKGLMLRKNLAADAGMLFYFKHERIIDMWMRHTLIPLDMVFISKEGIIIKITKNAVPNSLDRITSGKPVVAVLELNGGTSDKLLLVEGNKVHYPPFFQ